MTRAENHYQTLRVAPTASAEEIDDAYHRLLSEYATKVGVDPAAESELREIRWAYAHLSGQARLRA